jgi:rhomboid protease GluP
MRLFRRIQYNSPVILTFALLSLGSLILGTMTDGYTTAKFFMVYRSSLADPLTYPRFFLHVLGHASYAHYMSNILLMLVIGPPLEEKYGSRPLLMAIIITAFISGLVQWLFFPGQGLLGASGIVFMMIVISSLAGMRSGSVPLTLILVVIFYLGGELVTSMDTQDQISQLTHIIGGICGAALGFFFLRRR